MKNKSYIKKLANEVTSERRTTQNTKLKVLRGRERNIPTVTFLTPKARENSEESGCLSVSKIIMYLDGVDHPTGENMSKCNFLSVWSSIALNFSKTFSQITSPLWLTTALQRKHAQKSGSHVVEWLLRSCD